MVASGIACYFFKNRDTITDSSTNKSKKSTLENSRKSQKRSSLLIVLGSWVLSLKKVIILRMQ